MSRILAAVCLAVLCVVAAGCGAKTYTGERRFPLSGKVTVDGQPMPHGVISFLPQDKGRVSGGPITNGTYSVAEGSGANAGKYRIEIRWNKPTGKKVKDWEGEEIMDEYKEGLPARYHENSELTAEITAKQTTFDFDLNSK